MRAATYAAAAKSAQYDATFTWAPDLGNNNTRTVNDTAPDTDTFIPGISDKDAEYKAIGWDPRIDAEARASMEDEHVGNELCHPEPTATQQLMKSTSTALCRAAGEALVAHESYHYNTCLMLGFNRYASEWRTNAVLRMNDDVGAYAAENQVLNAEIQRLSMKCGKGYRVGRFSIYSVWSYWSQAGSWGNRPGGLTESLHTNVVVDDALICPDSNGLELVGTATIWNAQNLQDGKVPVSNSPNSPGNGTWFGGLAVPLYCPIPEGVARVDDPLAGDCGTFQATLLFGDSPSLQIQSSNDLTHPLIYGQVPREYGTDGPKILPLTETEDCSKLLRYQGRVVYNPFDHQQSPITLMPQSPMTQTPQIPMPQRR